MTDSVQAPDQSTKASFLPTSALDYDLPKEQIAQSPIEPRDHSRLLIVNRRDRRLIHTRFYELPQFLSPRDVIVVNDTRVIPARLKVRCADTDAGAELLLLRVVDESRHLWEALVRPGKGARSGRSFRCVSLTSALFGRFEGKNPQGATLVSFGKPSEEVLKFLEEAGEVPLPPYIRQPVTDPSQYQTIFAREPGSIAAPTAGFHFTPSLVQRLREMGVDLVTITLHVGWATFKPIKTETVDQHQMGEEFYRLPPEAAQKINRCWESGKKVVAVGTTTVRTLESCADGFHSLVSKSGWTQLFITPGHRFQAVDALITNFHLPRSTNLALVAAFIGDVEWTREIYEEAVRHGYRFYSFGDAMLIL